MRKACPYCGAHSGIQHAPSCPSQLATLDELRLWAGLPAGMKVEGDPGLVSTKNTVYREYVLKSVTAEAEKLRKKAARALVYEGKRLGVRPAIQKLRELWQGMVQGPGE